ncbi:MAG: ATP-binding protein [Bacteroidetes bacterium HGW-Bacteroidetes-17]|jgi:nitrogen fixation/metabolism regulation signal transduction histidine kinase|nr:MAG: ATP-binding protein [Bacteroidetes bacterium HGW-Bacteroidetes-17]
MVYNRFRFLVIARIILLTLSIFLLVYLAEFEKYLISLLIVGALIIAQVISAIRFVENTNKKLGKFLESIRHADFATSFSDKGMGKSFEGLNNEFNQIINEFKRYRAEKEEHFNYLQTVVQHVSIGIISFTRDGKVDIINTAGKRLFKISNLRYIDDLKLIKKDLPEMLYKMKAGDNTLIKLFIKDELLQLSVYATEFRMRGEEYTLIALQNIHAELEEKEIESWQKLIRVLTHEIMNSITPISSLASTVQEMMFVDPDADLRLKELDQEDMDGIGNALKTIQKRSQGLLNFVEIYRNLTRIPKPNFRYFEVKELFERSSELMKPKMDIHKIQCTSKVMPDDLKITADPDLVDQVIINLMLNAIDAVSQIQNPQIFIMAYKNDSGRVLIEISDNGSGIKPDILDKIFMPFFTSKKTGSGIGLSLSRQIMSLHKGAISVRSTPRDGTTFTLTF